MTRLGRIFKYMSLKDRTPAWNLSENEECLWANEAVIICLRIDSSRAPTILKHLLIHLNRMNLLGMELTGERQLSYV